MLTYLRRRLEGSTGSEWWSPPCRMDRRAWRVLWLLCLLSYLTGYMGTLLTQTNTFFGEDFGASDSDLGWLQGLVRVGALASLALVAAADRRGRRRVLLAAAAVGCLATAAGALAPGMAWIGATQTVARSCSMAVAILVAIVAVEEMPAKARAYAISVLVMAAALGAGLAVMLLPVAGLGAGTWRILFAIPLLALWPIALIARRLPETRRFLSAQRPREPSPGDQTTAPPVRTDRHVMSRDQRARLALLGTSAFCLEIFVAPAAGFLNEYLRTDQGFSALQLSLLTICTNTPAGLGILVGGRIADVRGRRVVGAIGLAVGTVFTVGMYLATGWGIWAASLVGAVVGAMAIPALGVYSPELFPTSARGKANGLVNLARVGGSFVGLVGAGLLSDRLAGGLSGAMVLLAAGPAVVVVLVLALYPETSGRELEELNPTDAPLRREILEMDGLDPDSSPGTWLTSTEPGPPSVPRAQHPEVEQ